MFTFNAGLCWSSAQLLRRKCPSNAHAAPRRHASSMQTRLAAACSAACDTGSRGSGGLDHVCSGNQNDAITAACTSRYQCRVYVRRRSTCPISFLFFRAYSYSRRRRETCPRGKQVCSTANTDDLFRCRGRFARSRPALARFPPQCGNDVGNVTCTCDAQSA
jgi:hypothetical protein